MCLAKFGVRGSIITMSTCVLSLKAAVCAREAELEAEASQCVQLYWQEKWAQETYMPDVSL